MATLVLKYIGCALALLSDPKNCAGGGREGGPFWGDKVFCGLEKREFGGV